jgi:NAD(P)H-nitrite reductase large subunit
MTRTVIIGASVAGFVTARGLRAAGYEGQVVLVGDEPHLPYDRPPLSKQILSGAWGEERVWMCDEADLATQGIDFRKGVRAQALDADRRSVALSTGEELTYQNLVIATGLQPILPPFWASTDGVCALRTLNDVRAVRARLEKAHHIVIAGAGFIGAEAAAALVNDHRRVTMVDLLHLPMGRALPAAVAQLLAEVHREHGVMVRCGTAVEQILTVAGEVSGLRLSDGEVIDADLVIAGLGARPNTRWLEGSGVPIADGVMCDEFCRATRDVYAAGDVASWINPRFGCRMRVEHRMHAAEQGAYVARAIAAGSCSEPFAPVPFFWSDQFNLRLQAYGHLSATDTLEVVEGSLEERRFVATCSRDHRIVAVLGLNMARQTRAARDLIG